MGVRRSWRVLATAMIVALSLGMAGCADPVEDNPKKAFVDAVKALGDQPGATVTARLVADAHNIAAVAESEGDPVEVEDVEKLLNSSLVFSWHQGADADDSDDDQGQLEVNVDGSDAVELRYDGQDLYLRADVGYLTELSGDAPSSEDTELYLDELEAAGFDFARAAYDGRWLRLIGADQAQSFFEGLAEGGGHEAPDTAEQAEKLAAAAQSALRDLLRDDVEVVHVGADSLGDKVVVSVTLRALGEALVTVLETDGLASGYWGSDIALLREELAEFARAGEEVRFEAWLAGGRLRQLQLDLVGLARQFDETGDVPAELQPVHLQLEFADFRDGVVAPDDAVEVDLFKIMGQAMGGLGVDGLDWTEPGTAPPGWEPGPAAPGWEPGSAPPDWEPDAVEPDVGKRNVMEPRFEEPDWEQMSDEEVDERMREFERQLDEEFPAN